MLANEVYEEGFTKDDEVIQVLDVETYGGSQDVEISLWGYRPEWDDYYEAYDPQILLDKAGVKRLIGILEESLTRMEEAE